MLVGAVACTEGPEVTTIGDEEPGPRVRATEVPGGSAAATSTGAPTTTEDGKPTAPTTVETTTTETTVDETTTTTTSEPPPTTAPTTDPPDTTEPGTTGHAAASVDFANQHRAEAELAGLQVDPELTALADAWARQMLSEQELYHNPNLSQQMPSHYMAWGENVAYNSDPTGIDPAWWASDGHRANIMNSSYTHVGVAFVADDRGVYWAVQVFAG